MAGFELKIPDFGDSNINHYAMQEDTKAGKRIHMISEIQTHAKNLKRGLFMLQKLICILLQNTIHFLYLSAYHQFVWNMLPRISIYL